MLPFFLIYIINNNGVYSWAAVKVLLPCLKQLSFTMLHHRNVAQMYDIKNKMSNQSFIIKLLIFLYFFILVHTLMPTARTWTCILFLCVHSAHTVAFSVSKGADSPLKCGNTKSWVRTWTVCLSWLWRASRCVSNPVCHRSVSRGRAESAQTLSIACSRDASIATSSRWFALGINKTLMRHFSNVGVESEDLMQFVCQALAGLSLIRFKHLHPVPLCAALPDIIPALSPPPAVAA